MAWQWIFTLGVTKVVEKKMMILQFVILSTKQTIDDHKVNYIITPNQFPSLGDTRSAYWLIQRLPSSWKKHTIRVLVSDWLAGGSHSDRRVYIREAREYTSHTSIIVVHTGSDLNYTYVHDLIWGGIDSSSEGVDFSDDESLPLILQVHQSASEQNWEQDFWEAEVPSASEGLGRIQAAWRVSDD